MRERVVPEEMPEGSVSFVEHLIRYGYSLHYCYNKNVLDAACGSGYGSKIIQSMAKNVGGLDIDEQIIQYARKKYSGIHFFVCDLEKDFPNKFYDVIVSFETIEHLKNPNYFLKKVSESCDKFIFSIPINNRNVYHKCIYSLDQATALIYKYFKNVHWFKQFEQNIYPHDFIEKVDFLIGVTSK